MLIILKPSMFSTTFEQYMCVLSTQIFVPIRDTLALVAVFLCACVFEKARNAVRMHIVFFFVPNE